MGKTRLKAKGRAKFVAITCERGRQNDGGLTETKVFHISPSGELKKKLKPKSSKMNRRTNQGRDTYYLRTGIRCLIVQSRIKKGKAFEGSARVVVRKNGKIEVEEWQGAFVPQFSFI